MPRNVPYLTEEAIERDAEALLADFSCLRNQVIEPPIPIEDIVEKLLRLGFEFDDLHARLGIPRTGLDLGNGPDILGAIFFDDKRIVIDESLDPEVNPAMEGRFRFTLAHEGGGHWRLHRPLFAKDRAQTWLSSGASAPSVVCRSSQGKERVEWQADFYASCLLMPKPMVMQAWEERFGDRSPISFEDDQGRPMVMRPRYRGLRAFREVLSNVFEPQHDYLFDNVAKIFAPAFGVSVQAMRIRLEKLGLLQREVPREKHLAGRA